MKPSIRIKIWTLLLLSGILFRCSNSDETARKLDINADVKRVYISHGVNFSLSNPTGVTEASWFFEGGEPEYFNDINPPTIYYGKEGVYSVTLNLVAAGQKQVLHKQNFILVQEEPDGRFAFISIHAEKESIKGGESTEVWVRAIGDDLEYLWSSNTGSFIGDGPKVEFKTGPCFDGIAEVNALVSNEYGSMERTVKINVERSQDF